MHREFTGLKRVPELLDEHEAIAGVLIDGGCEDGVAAGAPALGVVHGGVGVLEELAQVPAV